MRLALDLILPAERSLLAATRHALAVYLREFGTSDDVVDDVVLALDEACSNVVVHAFADPDGELASYRLNVDVWPDRVVVEVCDDGVGFDMMATAHPRAEDGRLATGGRGLEVMRRLMTSVEVESPTATGGTRLRLVRTLPPTAD